MTDIIIDGIKLKEARKAAGHSQSALAKEAEYSLRTIQRIEKIKEYTIDFEKAKKISKFVNFELEELYANNKSQPENANQVKIEDLEEVFESISIVPRKEYIRKAKPKNDQTVLIDEHFIKTLEKNLLTDDLELWEFYTLDFLVDLKFSKISISDLNKGILEKHPALRAEFISKAIHESMNSETYQKTKQGEYDCSYCSNTDKIFSKMETANYFKIESDLPETEEEVSAIAEFLDTLEGQCDILHENKNSNSDKRTKSSDHLKRRFQMKSSYDAVKDLGYNIFYLELITKEIEHRNYYEDHVRPFMEEWTWLIVFVVSKRNRNNLTQYQFRFEPKCIPSIFTQLKDEPSNSYPYEEEKGEEEKGDDDYGDPPF
jgi:DNA-binding XRE family transcriptional regulator